MKKNFKPRLSINPHERMRLNNKMYMENWQFELLFLKHCTELSSYRIHLDESSSEYISATIYGLQAYRKTSGQPCIANFFIRYQNSLYQVHDLKQAVNLVGLIEKEAKLDKLRRERWAIESMKKKEKIVMKQLKAA